MAASKAKGRRKPPRPPSRQQLLEHDPWHFRRIEDPVFEAIVQVLVDNPHVCYYSVDWRPWLEHVNPPAGGPVRDPDPICGSMSVRFNEAGLTPPRSATRRTYGRYRSGGGHLERFASGVMRALEGIVVTLPDDKQRTLTPSQGSRGVESEWKRWKKLPNGIELWTYRYPDGRQYEARHGRVEVGYLGLPRDAPPTGHIAGLFSYVQGNGAPCTTPEAWANTVARLQVSPGPRTVSEAVLSKLRHDYRFEVEGMAWFDTKQANRNARKRGDPTRWRQTPRWGFDRLMRECGFTKRLLAKFDREVARRTRLVERAAAKAAREAAKQAKTKPQPKQEVKKCQTKKSPSRSGSAARSSSPRGARRRAGSARSRTGQASAQASTAAGTSSPTSRSSAAGSSRPPRPSPTGRNGRIRSTAPPKKSSGAAAKPRKPATTGARPRRSTSAARCKTTARSTAKRSSATRATRASKGA